MVCSFAQEYSSGTTNGKVKKQTQQNDPKADNYNTLEARRVIFGVTFGPTFNWMNWKNHRVIPEGYDRTPGIVRSGLRYGVNMDIDLTKQKNFYVSTGILIEHTGGSLTFNDNIYLVNDSLTRTIDRKYKSIYFTIPTAVTFRTPSFSNFIICGNIGLYHSFNLYSRYQSSFQIDPSATETDKEGINHVTTDWSKDSEVSLFKESIFAGIGIEYVIKNNLKGKFYINYAQSLNNYFTKNAKNSLTSVQEKASIGTIELLFGLSF
jgi:hypothetical protein